ncbi:ABC transporter ATP-binding protein [[Clostridium] polysaccharolyticum]|uniref:Sulfonate transport system ATP-binding protein n=1 Tax=[Clostridium] polysaccharolyticum TaxID=29364 RepID=A0A1I0AD58_9FIRM|nr:ABC transporter ATP-binding protein [[Clostridium] polysaccharolyticum]SES91207.1 sulfonate transport system ATP-binding protein [[Clostridium] polysaccharolyticum]
MVGELRIQNVGKHFENADGSVLTALQNVNLNVKPGSFISLIGPSGCGKTTLLRAIAGLNLADEGTIFLDNKPVTKPGHDRGFAFQQANLYPWLSIEKNIAFGLKARGIYKSNKEEVKKYIEMVGLKGFESAYPHQLSGGMNQRASLARALVGHPKVLLLDEPLGALDAFTRMNMQDEILRIWKEHKMTMIMVTHDVDEAVYFSDQVVIMTPRPAKIEQIIDIELGRPRARGNPDFLKYRTQILEILNYAGEKKELEYYL